MCAWHLQADSCQPGEFHKKPTWLVSPGLYPWVRLFLRRKCPGVGPLHRHAALKGGSDAVPGVPRARVAQQYTVPLCAAWGLAVRAAFLHWTWPEYLAGQQALQTVNEFLEADPRAVAPPLVDFCDPMRHFAVHAKWFAQAGGCGRPRKRRRRRSC